MPKDGRQWPCGPQGRLIPNGRNDSFREPECSSIGRADAGRAARRCHSLVLPHLIKGFPVEPHDGRHYVCARRAEQIDQVRYHARCNKRGISLQIDDMGRSSRAHLGRGASASRARTDIRRGQDRLASHPAGVHLYPNVIGRDDDVDVACKACRALRHVDYPLQQGSPRDLDQRLARQSRRPEAGWNDDEIGNAVQMTPTRTTS